MISEEEMKNQIIQQCKRGGISFVELQDNVEDFKGDVSFGYGNNIFLWFNLSDQACHCLDDLIKSNTIRAAGSTPFVYAIDGCIPRFSVAKNVNHNYKEPRWLPVVFWYGKR